MKKLLFVTFMVLLATSFAFAGDSTKTETKAEPVKKAEAAPEPEKKAEACADSTKKAKKMEFVTTESGLKYADLVVGEGKEAVNGMKVECHYTLWVADENGEKGKMIQSSKDTGKTFTFGVGDANLIRGWNEGMLGMKEGGTRMLIIAPHLGYGDRPPQEGKDLIFELEFVKAK